MRLSIIVVQLYRRESCWFDWRQFVVVVMVVNLYRCPSLTPRRQLRVTQQRQVQLRAQAVPCSQPVQVKIKKNRLLTTYKGYRLKERL